MRRRCPQRGAFGRRHRRREGAGWGRTAVTCGRRRAASPARCSPPTCPANEPGAAFLANAILGERPLRKRLWRTPSRRWRSRPCGPPMDSSFRLGRTTFYPARRAAPVGVDNTSDWWASGPGGGAWATRPRTRKFVREQAPTSEAAHRRGRPRNTGVDTRRIEGTEEVRGRTNEAVNIHRAGRPCAPHLEVRKGVSLTTGDQACTATPSRRARRHPERSGRRRGRVPASVPPPCPPATPGPPTRTCRSGEARRAELCRCLAFDKTTNH